MHAVDVRRMEVLSTVSAGVFASTRRFRLRRGRFGAPAPLKRRRTSSSARSKSSDFQDFHGFAKPIRLLPTTHVIEWKKILDEEKLTFRTVDGSQSLYRVKIYTSRMYGSGLSDGNAGLLLCIIDENGNSILQRISAISDICFSSDLDEEVDPHKLRFQRGSVDEFAFTGPKLGKHLTVWVGTESGQWRLAGLNLSVVSPCQDSPEDFSSTRNCYQVYRYDFDAEETVLGGSNDSSMAELRARRVTEISGQDPFTLLNESIEETILPSPLVSAEESMREYSDLKLSLLLYDAVLISAGAMVTTFSSGKSATLAFLTGGLGGFLYLWLLQRSVDELSAPASISQSTINKAFGQLRGPVLRATLAIAFAIVALKYSSGEVPVSFTPKDLILGMMGFLVCKVAVVLAAFKPISVRLKPND